MNESSPPELTPNPETPDSKPTRINMGVATVAVVLVIVNFYLGFKIGSAQGKFGGELFGIMAFALGRAVLLPVVFVGVCSISKTYRNNAARVKIIMWVSVFVLISSMGGLSKLAA
jgi:hypothetical protein